MKIRITRYNNYLENYEKADAILFQESYGHHIITPGKKWKYEFIRVKGKTPIPSESTSQLISKTKAITEINLLIDAGCTGYFIYSKKPANFYQD